MKILFTQDALFNAGAERSHLEILSRFSEEVDVGFVYFYPKHDLRKAYDRAGIRLFFLDIPESYHFILAVRKLVKLIRQEKPNLLVSSLWRADIITRIASWITGVPLIGTLVNDSYAPIAWTDKKGIKYKIVYWLDRLTAGIPVHWIANAQTLADSHVKTLGIDRDKISVVYRGRPVPIIARNVIAPARGGGSDAKQSSSVKTDSPATVGIAVTDPIRNFISYGRLLERKGFQDAIRAFDKVLQTYPDCTLIIFGEGPFRKELELLVQDLGLQDSVFLPGKLPNPMEVLLNGYSPMPTVHCSLLTTDYFLFPSWYEGFSGALVEAMMVGIPIIASDIPMKLEAVTDQKTALVFPVQDINDLAKQMLWAIENHDAMKALGRNAKEVAEDRFDIENVAKEYEERLLNIHFQLIRKK